ncbi:MAG TPA: uracil-DNA glycosylase [Candidatus Dormibacteraeota bacterium]|nr:uracil-DNA glycosylase [Candidatus Dormibacteraeota bacterium]
MTKTNKQLELDKLKNQIIDQNVCPELANNATNLVFGSGNIDTKICFIGEAPGKNEDIQGLPFVGASGKFLNEMLEAINLSRDQVYITNIVKYRPPDNRDPLLQEKAIFMPFLNKQIEIINPKLIVTLGRHSMNCFFPELTISVVHGKLQKIGDRFFLPLFHPAAALYNGLLKKTLISDFQQIPSILNTI